MGEAPVLIDGEIRLTQSGCNPKLYQRKDRQIWRCNAAERREILRWVLWDNHKLSSNAGALRFMMNFLPEAKRSADVIGYLGRSVESVLQGAGHSS